MSICLVLFSDSVLIRVQRNINDRYETKDDKDTLAKNKEWYHEHNKTTPKPSSSKGTTLYVVLCFVAGLVVTIIWTLCKSQRCNCIDKIDELCCSPIRRALRHMQQSRSRRSQNQRSRNRNVSNGLICKCFSATPYLYVKGPRTIAYPE